MYDTGARFPLLGARRQCRKHYQRVALPLIRNDRAGFHFSTSIGLLQRIDGNQHAPKEQLAATLLCILPSNISFVVCQILNNVYRWKSKGQTAGAIASLEAAERDYPEAWSEAMADPDLAAQVQAVRDEWNKKTSNGGQ